MVKYGQLGISVYICIYLRWISQPLDSTEDIFTFSNTPNWESTNL